jgi:hypothetical protein
LGIRQQLLAAGSKAALHGWLLPRTPFSERALYETG